MVVRRFLVVMAIVMVLPALSVLLSEGVSVSSSDQVPWTGDVPDIYLDAVIGEEGKTTIFQNLTIGLNQTQTTIYGTVIMRNVTINLDMYYQIANLGKLIFTDIDNDPSTTEDGSSIASVSYSTLIYNDLQEGEVEINVTNSRTENIVFMNEYENGRINIVNSDLSWSILDNRFDGGASSGISLKGSTLTDGWIRSFNATIEDSILQNVSLDLGPSSVKRSQFLNSSMDIDGSKALIDLVFINVFDYLQYPIRTSTNSIISAMNLTIEDFSTGIVHTQGSLELIGTSILNCTRGVQVAPSATLYLDSSNILGSSLPVTSEGPVQILSSVISNGTVEMKGSSFISQASSFMGIEGISGIISGMVLNSTFEECPVGLISPTGVTVRGSRFIECGTAVQDDVGSFFYHNSFIDCKHVVDGIPASNWYNSEIREGNYYSSYNGLDDGSGDRTPNDGKGDTNLPFLGRDMYPLMKDRYWDMPEIPEVIIEYDFGSDIVNLSWNSPDISSNFIVQRASDPIFSQEVTSWSVGGASLSIKENPNSTLHFRVAAFGSGGFRGWSTPVKITVNQAPLHPVDITVEPLMDGGSLKVRWEHQGEDINKTFIFFSDPDGPISYRDVLHPQNEYVIENLDNGIIYNITLVAVDHSGLTSSSSPNITGIPSDTVPPPPPRRLRGEAKSNTSIQISWDPPLIQDISSYKVLRGDSGSDLMEIANLSRLSLDFLDTGLKDRTDYRYGVIAVDDDGPLSEIAGPITVTTLHFNNEPEFNGDYQLISLEEDSAPFSIPISDLVSDPDGDPLIVVVQDSYPFQAEMVDGTFWIVPGKDQAGEGFVRVLASDGESSTFADIGILIQEVPDPPEGVSILTPTNGAVLLPGTPSLLLADGYDPDIPYGDILTYRWESDRDGPLNGMGTQKENIYASLTPGIHRISLTVTDSNGTMVVDSVTVMVSIWGWGDIPWSAGIIESKVGEQGGSITVRISNDGPLQITFIVGPGDEPSRSIIGDRGILVGPSSKGDLVIEVIPPLVGGSVIPVSMLVSAETLNGTYAGEFRLNGTLEVEKPEGSDEGQLIVIILIGASAVIAVIGIIVIILIGRTSLFIGDKGNIEKDPNVANGRR